MAGVVKADVDYKGPDKPSSRLTVRKHKPAESLSQVRQKCGYEVKKLSGLNMRVPEKLTPGRPRQRVRWPQLACCLPLGMLELRRAWD